MSRVRTGAAATLAALGLSLAAAPVAAADVSPTPTVWLSPGEGARSGAPVKLTGSSSSVQLRRTALVLIDESRKGKQTSLTLSSDVLFATDSAELSASSHDTLNAVADRIKAAGPSGPVRVVGYTDTDGSRAHNQDLSTRRARAVSGYLEGRVGGTGTKLRPSGRGERDLAVSPERSAADKAKNRRVTITYETVIAPTDTDVSVGPDTTARKAAGSAPEGSVASAGATFRTYSAPAKLRLDVMRVERQGPFVYVAMRLTVVSVGGGGTSFGDVDNVFSGDRLESDPSRTVLYDRKADTAEQIVINGKGQQLRSAIPGYIDTGGSADLWFWFSAPESRRGTLDLYVPAFGVLRDLPVKGA